MKNIILLVVCIGLLLVCGGMKKDKTEYQRMTITYYCPCKICCGKYGGKYTTSNGTYFKGKFNIRICAIDRKYYKYGDRFTVDGIAYTAEDIGGAIKQNHIDLLVYDRPMKKYCTEQEILKYSHNKALRLGTKNIMVKVEKNKK